MTEIADQTLYQQRRHLDLADDRVATATQQAAHPTCRVLRDTNTQPLDQPCHADVLLELANEAGAP